MIYGRQLFRGGREDSIHRAIWDNKQAGAETIDLIKSGLIKFEKNIVGVHGREKEKDSHIDK